LVPFQAFDIYANQYDAWFDNEPGKTIFAMEVNCLRPLFHKYGKPNLEIGVGSGRFAQALGVEYGVEPAPSMLQIAKGRGIRVVEAYGEKTPFPDRMFGSILIALTLCFVNDPAAVLREAWRLLVPGGGLAIGLIPGNSPWGDFYAGKAKEGHPLYSRARFFFISEITDLLKDCGFEVNECCSTLFQPPGQELYRLESPLSGCHQAAGFVAITCEKTTP
jgi:SAM-dependent methyltransferase